MDTKPPKEHTSVWILSLNNQERVYHCHRCKYPLFHYKGTVIRIVPGNANEKEQIMSAPTQIHCRGKSERWGPCNVIYHVEHLVVADEG